MTYNRNFGTRIDGQDVTAHELYSKSGFKAVILNHGAILQALYLPDGRNVTLGFETWNSYETDNFRHGCIIGRNANRIKEACFQINGATSKLKANDGAHNLHSGPNGFDRQIWDVTRRRDGLELKHSSPDGHDGFPGDVDVSLLISLEDNRLRLEINASTTKPTPINITWHPYWNLNGTQSTKGGHRIDGHDLQITAERRTEFLSADSISVKNTRFDFQSSLPLGQIKIDENYIDAARAKLIANQTSLTVTSSLPDMQIYTGDHLAQPRTGIAIEPQFRPNDINIEQLSLLQPGETYRHWIDYHFNPA